ncbi:cmgc kinase [Fusarium mundagurra]|uniref:Cmgc kinase n=1 Tax=Fusarium mundagurra TaxID=1567541 RepID=A0A8H5XT06_9HYPO|nr:cmgc kinase [Fusarium mundagurra]
MATESDDVDCASVWGDFVGSDDECEVEDACEPIERYEEGLYYPVCIGEVLIDRYRVEHKLGHGGFSTVWMAHDMLSNNNVALKIMSPGPSGEREYTAQTMIASTVQDTSRLLTYRDTFLLPGAPQTYHRVLVFPLLGPSLQTYASFMSIATRRSSAKQLLHAIKALHDAGVVHRDINSANVLYGLAPFNNDTTITTKYEYLGRPRKMPIPTSRPLWKDGQLVMPIVPHHTLVQGTITLADFGLAIKSGTSLEDEALSPAIYCAPERIHNVHPSFASDMWSYMCIFAELYLGFPLFYGSAYSSAVDFMVKSLGPLPSSWKGSYDGGGQYDESWYNQDRRPDSHHTLEAKIKRAIYDISPVEQRLVFSILQRGLSYSPEHRFSARQLLEDVSFKELMAIYGL